MIISSSKVVQRLFKSCSRIVQGLFKSSSIVVLLLICYGVAFSADYRCGGDVNGDDIVDPQTETQVCTQTQQGYLCPIQKTACQVTSVDPQCPSGMIWNPLSRQCEVKPLSGTCPDTSFNFDTSIGVCVTYKQYNSGCPSGSLPGYLCSECAQDVVCPYDSSYKCSSDQSSGICVASPRCPQGTSFFDGKCVGRVSDGTCPQSFTFDKTIGLCTKQASCYGETCLCPQGSYLWEDRRLCVLCAQKPVCPAGSKYRCSVFIPGGWCEASSCPSGTFFNPDTSQCEGKPYSGTCSSPYSFNSSTGTCTVQAFLSTRQLW
jgi:hypothetical protein